MRSFNPTKLSPPRGYDGPDSLLIKNRIQEAPNLDLEIGAGVGWHAIQYSQAHPNRLLLAIERTQEKFTKFQQRFLHHPDIKNLIPIHADVVPWAVHFLPLASLDRIFILYPNLYPKNPSARFFKMPFFEYLLQLGKPQMTIHLASNDFDYQEEAQREAHKTWGLECIHFKELTFENTSSPRTHFEKKYLLRKETCYDLIFQKKSGFNSK